MKRLFALLSLFLAAHANAGVMSFALGDIGAFSGLRNTNTAATYAGNGYLGMSFGGGSYAWSHVLGAERASQSRTLIQVDLSGLAGKTVSGAILSFDLREGDSGAQAATLVGYDAGDGDLAFTWNAPAVRYGQVATTLTGRATNDIDVTALVSAGAASDSGWLGLHLQGSTKNQWTYANYNAYAADRAKLLLTVLFDDAVTVPEPDTASLVCGALGLLAWRRRTGRRDTRAGDAQSRLSAAE